MEQSSNAAQQNHYGSSVVLFTGQYTVPVIASTSIICSTAEVDKTNLLQASYQANTIAALVHAFA